jgi:hypothetical protein
MVPGLIPGGVTGDFFRGSPWQNHVPWGRLSPWKWVPGIYPGVKAAGAFGSRPTTLVVPNVKKIQCLNLPRTPWATSACCGMTFYKSCSSSLCSFSWTSYFWTSSVFDLWSALNVRDCSYKGYCLVWIHTVTYCLCPYILLTEDVYFFSA